MKQSSPLNPVLAAALDTSLALVSPAGKDARLSILIYHRVLPTPDPVRAGDPDAKRFHWQMQLLARHFNVLPLHEAAARLRAGALPARAACITFDDGYADNYTIALPILQELGLHATFFVATAYLDGGRMFNDTLIEIAKSVPNGACDLSHLGLGTHQIASTMDRCTLLATLINHFKYLSPETRIPASDSLAAQFHIQLPNDLMMTSHQLKALSAAGMEIGAHTHSHPILSRQRADDAHAEIRLGKQRLEALLDTRVRLFAYPNGRPTKDYGEEHVAMVPTCGFEAAVSTRPAAADQRSDIYQLPRFTPWDTTPGRFAFRLLRSRVFPHSAGG